MENLFTIIFRLLKVNQLVALLSRSHDFEGYEEVFKLLLHHVHSYTPHFDYKSIHTYDFEPCKMQTSLNDTNPIVSKLFELMTFEEMKQLAQNAGKGFLHNEISLEIFSLISNYTIARQTYTIKQLKKDNGIKELKLINEMVSIKENNMELAQ